MGLVSTPTVVKAGCVQLPGLTVPVSAATDRASVVQIFNESYNTYREFAWGHDEVAPLSQAPLDPLNGWGASIVDAMSTMYIMGLTDFFNEALNFTQNIDFTKSNTADTVSLSTTIRYVGGLISADIPFLVDTAKQLADRLSLAWSKGNTVPFGHLDFNANTVDNQIVRPCTIDITRTDVDKCTMYTGNDTYRKLAEGSVLKIAANAFPAQAIDPSTGLPVGGYVSWGGGSDSYFEYLIKYARLSNTNDSTTLIKTSTVGNHVYLADYDSKGRIRHVGSHLACFYAGNWLLGGKLTNNDTIVRLALQLNDGCWNTYTSDATGIGPEAFAYTSADGNFTGNGNPSAEQLAFYNHHGFYITDPFYVQRPEVLESNFYAWRVTGNHTYLQRARSAIASFNRFLSTQPGFAGIYDVNDPKTPRVDETESFWFAEVLKYLYLTFDDPNRISLDEYVFNTEAHPFLAPPAKAVYGSGQYCH
ncbi:seven-hairpin glycosidase [Lactarius pseudohatsudake]|nr:seven-hairpin glycosidase [Lactarius pseudohatsudake]